jgi:hypothetical protein
MDRFLLVVLIASAVSLSTAQPNADGCCTPPQWTSDAVTINSLGSVHHKIAYDSIRNWVRWDRFGTLEKAGIDETIITWTDYNKLIEYVWFVDQNLCEQYGPDTFYAWCFGSTISQVSVAPLTVAGQRATLWASKFGGPFQWVSMDNGCLPLSTSQVGFFTTNFFNTTVGPAPSSTWSMPDVCTRPPVKAAGASKRNPLNRLEIRP